ncbi:Electron transfer flavoprotein, alpha subunit-like protein [Alkaliphilus metalliredigens QYMF]|uniref:Electron transfer flavoprotein, alpha subunit-like protein n=1 Tax=Alkaliphilus metalliredigens (strain QYMF) TaxID=293826 RepID=A6TUJ9_ALKMQ|nr:electron transfer flavoprotein subunit alpha/FixB family protein [Alkaliphilus metalliredigens]ABR49867.1 Electron transfer flavoprotein, alpha subunit-like protein [Alkaliphilus metalliredigens QYMF]
MSYVWTIAEQSKGKLKGVSFELLSRGRKLADQMDTQLCSVLMGSDVTDETLQELIQRGADNVYFVDDPRLENFIVETYSNVLSDLINEYEPHSILAAATSSGRSLMPYVAIQVKTGLTADCTELEIEEGTNHLLQTRPAIGGNIMATIKTPDHTPQMATVRPKSSRPLPIDETREGKIIRLALKDELVDDRVQMIGFRKDDEEFVNIEEAEVVVAGGKGMKKADNFKMLKELAKNFDGVVGATRDAVDRGWMAYPYQIGLSGKTISPRLYICAGVSGSIQHLAGIKTSEVIIAINTDPDANIFQLADFGIVGNLFEVLPKLNERLESYNEGGKKDELQPSY